MEQYLIIDVGGTNIKSALMTKNGKIISKKQLSTAKNLDDFKEQILLLVAEVAEKSRESPSVFQEKSILIVR